MFYHKKIVDAPTPDWYKSYDKKSQGKKVECY